MPHGDTKKKQKTKKQKVKMTAGRLLGIVNYPRAHRPMHACNKKKSYPKYKSSCTFSCTLTHITLQPLDDNRRRSTTTVTDGSNALLTLLQSVHQGDDNSGTRRTDRLRVFFFRVSSRNFSPAKKKKEDDVRDRERRHHL